MGIDTTDLTRAAYYLIPDDAAENRELVQATRDCLTALMIALEWQYKSWDTSSNTSTQLAIDIACDTPRLRAMLKKFPSYEIDESRFPDITRLLSACLAKQAAQGTSANANKEPAMTLTPADLTTIRDIVREEIRLTLEYPPDLVRWNYQLKIADYLRTAIRDGLSKARGQQLVDDAAASAKNALNATSHAYLDTARLEMREIKEMIVQIHDIMRRDSHDDQWRKSGPQGDDTSKDDGPEQPLLTLGRELRRDLTTSERLLRRRSHGRFGDDSIRHADVDGLVGTPHCCGLNSPSQSRLRPGRCRRPD